MATATERQPRKTLVLDRKVLAKLTRLMRHWGEANISASVRRCISEVHDRTFGEGEFSRGR